MQDFLAGHPADALDDGTFDLAAVEGRVQAAADISTTATRSMRPVPRSTSTVASTSAAPMTW